MTRTFIDKPAVRDRVPLLVGLMGPSGGGKTYSALRLATGIQRVNGGKIFVVDTEARRALHYADRFDFRHVAFGAPFGPLDYLAAIEHCVNEGASVIVVDSMSHEHEGPGGVLEMHDVEAQRLAKLWKTTVASTNLAAWGEPKRQRRRMINTILQQPVSMIFCFRAKEKIKVVKGKDPQQLGWMAIAAEEFIYEMTANCLLLPGSNGVPTLSSKDPGSAAMIKVPEQFRGVFDDRRALDEDLGEKLARWAEGTETVTMAGLLEGYATCADHAGLGALEQGRRSIWRAANADEKKQLKTAADEAKARIDAAEDEDAADSDEQAGEEG